MQFWLFAASVFWSTVVSGEPPRPGVVIGWGNNSSGEVAVPDGLTNTVAVQAGYSHSLALKSDGKVIGWGKDVWGQASPPAGLSNVTSIAAGWLHSLALKSDGRVAGWGYDGFGQTDIPAGLSNVIAIAANGHHSLGLKSDGTVVGWGYNSSGQIDTPAGLSNATAIAAGANFSLALKLDGTLVSWGAPNSLPLGLSNIVAIAAGSYHTLALTTNGTVLAWGNNSYGQLNVPPGLSNVVAIAAGGVQSLALRNDGTVTGWGCGGCFGVLPVPDGLSGVVAIASGNLHNLAITRAPIIAQQPASQTAVSGATVSFSVVVLSADALFFQWIANGTNISGGTNSTLVLTNVRPEQAGGYAVLVNNLAGSVRSATAILTVYEVPTILALPVDQTVLAGGQATFAVTATGTTPLTYQWKFNGSNIPGATNASLTLTNVQWTNQGDYRVAVSNIAGAILSAPATLGVQTPPIITTQPTNRTVLAGDQVSFSLIATGTPPLAYRWKFNGTYLIGVSNSNLILTNAQPANSGTYQAVVLNSFGSATSAIAVLTVKVPPTIILEPLSQTVSAGTNVILSVSAAGAGPLSFQWRLNDAALTGATNSVLSLTNVQAGQAGAYIVVVSNSVGTLNSATAVLEVFPAVPGILTQPMSQSVPAGTSVLFSVIAIGTAPLAYQWSFDGNALAGASESSLVLTNVQEEQAGSYSVLVTNSQGAVSSDSATLTVLPTPPLLLTSPSSRAVFENEPTIFTVSVRGSMPFSYQWQFEGQDLPEATNNDLSLSSPQSTDAGNYRVIVSNSSGAVTSAIANLTVVGAPVGQLDWPQIRLGEAASGALLPTHITHAGDSSGRLFLVEKHGRIRIIQGGGFLSTAFLDISDRVLDSGPGGEQGLFCLAFPPGYNAKGYCYVNYTRKPDGATVVSRFFVTTNANVANPGSEQIVLTVAQPYSNHNGGALAFGPDGFLYIGMGDGGGQGDPDNRAQNPASLLGKILRIDVETSTNGYSIPPNNPLVMNPSAQPEIWALGLRNPWRISFDRLTGDLFVADVGEDMWEEIDFQSAGGAGGQNYGWRLKEGNHDFDLPPEFDTNSLTAPVWEYGHDQGSSITGGFVFRGPGSARLTGIYLYGDYGSGRIWGLQRDGTNWPSRELLHSAYHISTFGEDESGRIYLADYSGGKLYVIEDTGQANPPRLQPAGGTFNTEQTVTLFSDNPGTIIRYTLDGRSPTEADDGVVSGTTLLIGSNLVLKVRAFRPDLAPSDIVVGSFSFQVATPEFNPASGPITNGTRVAISCATPGATLHYTLDGSEPVVDSPAFSAPFPMLGNVTLKAKAFKPLFNDSAIRTMSFGLISYENGNVSTVAGTGQPGFRDGDSGSAQFSSPQGICMDALGNIYVADTGNNRIRKITPTNWVVTVAGSGLPGALNGPASLAQFSAPIGIGLDGAANLYVADSGNNLIRKIDSSSNVTTFSSSPYLGQLEVAAGGQPYVAGWAQIYTISPTGVATRFAGTGINNFFAWSANVGVGLDLSGNVYAAIAWGRILRIPAVGLEELFAGSSSGFADGPRLMAQFVAPHDITVDRLGNVYVSDGSSIRQIDPNGQVTTLAGNTSPGYEDGPAAFARFNSPAALCVDPNGNVYVADTGNHCLRRIAPIDWDRDGIPDAEEGGLTPYVVGIDDRLVDSDGDGQSNAAEYLAGTDPRNAGSFLAIVNFVVSTNEASLSWPSAAGRTYQVEFSDDLIHWQKIGNPVPGAGSLLSNTHSTDARRGFYRVVVGR